MPGMAPTPIGLGLYVQDVPAALDLVGRAEQAGVESAWMVMGPAGYDTPTLAAAALARTRDLRIGTSIVPAFTRHPLALATQAVVLAQLAPGRFRLGIGTGNLAVMAEGFGTPLDRPVARMREYLDVLRPALATGEVRHPGRYYGVDAALPAAGPQDIHVAAMGPHMFALAGELADGAMSWMCPLDHLDAVARPALARGAARAGRPVPPLVTHLTAVVEPDPRRAREIARPLVRGFGTIAPFAAQFAAAGMPVGHDGAPSDELVDAVIVSGDEAGLTDVLAKLAEREDELLVTLQPSADPRADEDTLLRVLARLRD